MTGEDKAGRQACFTLAESGSLHTLGLNYERLVHRRAVVLATDAILGLSVVLIWMSRQDFQHLSYWRRAGGIHALATALVAGWPYIAAAIVLYRSTSFTRLGLAALEVVLLTGTFIAGLVYLKASSPWAWITVLPICQAVLFIYAAKRLATPRTQ